MDLNSAIDQPKEVLLWITTIILIIHVRDILVRYIVASLMSCRCMPFKIQRIRNCSCEFEGTVYGVGLKLIDPNKKEE